VRLMLTAVDRYVQLAATTWLVHLPRTVRAAYAMAESAEISAWAPATHHLNVIRQLERPATQPPDNAPILLQRRIQPVTMATPAPKTMYATAAAIAPARSRHALQVKHVIPIKVAPALQIWIAMTATSAHMTTALIISVSSSLCLAPLAATPILGSACA